MRALLGLLLLPLLLAAAPARDWTATVTKTAAGAYVLGNPAAPVKLVEYASYSCPHCAAFAAESGAVLKGRMIKSGSTSLEVRNYIRDAPDLAAAIVARCTGPKRFFPTSDAIFTQQPLWLPRAIDFQQDNALRLAGYSDLARLRAIADGSGLSGIGRAAGLTDAALDACFADQAEVNRIIAMTQAATGITGTPGFLVNGKHVNIFTWTGLQPILRAHGAK